MVSISVFSLQLCRRPELVRCLSSRVSCLRIFFLFYVRFFSLFEMNVSVVIWMVFVRV